MSNTSQITRKLGTQVADRETIRRIKWQQKHPGKSMPRKKERPKRATEPLQPLRQSVPAE